MKFPPPLPIELIIGGKFNTENARKSYGFLFLSQDIQSNIESM